MPTAALFLVFSLLGACAHKSPASAVTPPIKPILPSPEAEVYATGHSAPRDSLVAQASSGLPWDEGLSGAAGALALAQEAPDLSQAAWAAWRAGYPYRVKALMSDEVAKDGAPDALVAQLRERVVAGEHVGLARARVGDGDRWVALIGDPAGVTLAPVSRTVQVGEALSLSGTGLAHYSLVSPTGALSEGALPASPRLAESGEWWLALDAGQAVTISLPIYAGIQPPPTGPVRTPGERARDAAGAVAEASAIVAALREDFDLPAVRADETLNMLVKDPLEQARGGHWDAAALQDRIKHVGFSGPVAGAWCSADTVPLCLDRMLRTVGGRVALLNPDQRLMGIAAVVHPDSVELALALAGE